MEAQKGPGTVGGAVAKGGFTEPPLGHVLMVRGVPVGLLCYAEPWSVVVLLLRSVSRLSLRLWWIVPCLMLSYCDGVATLLGPLALGAWRTLQFFSLVVPMYDLVSAVFFPYCFSMFIMEDKLVLFRMLSALLVWLPRAFFFGVRFCS